MRPRTALFGTLGILATGLGGALLFAPGRARGIGPVEDAVTVLGSVEATTVGLVAGVVTLLAFFAAVRPRRSPPAGGPTPADPGFPRASSEPGTGRSLAGGGLDADIDRAVEQGGEPLQELQSALYETATSAYADRAGVPAAEAASAVDSGGWTDDRLAACFLGQEPFPLWLRLRCWLVPEQARRRRIERTVAAIERLSDR